MRVIVCGGRKFGEMRDIGPKTPKADSERIKAEHFAMMRALDAIHRETPITWIVHGNARGADHAGAIWSRMNGANEMTFHPDWKRYGRRAGPIRNGIMLAEGCPDLVVAFPGNVGTADMTARAEAAGVRVVRPLE